MKNLIFTICIFFCLGLNAQNNSKIRLNFNIILNPINGSRPNGITNATINEAVDWMNERMNLFSRGLEFEVSGITEVGGIGTTLSNSFFSATLDVANRDALEISAEANTATYNWSSNRINIYLNDPFDTSNGICSFPTAEVIYMRARTNPNFQETVIHEVGHFFDLCHTQGCPCGSCDTGSSGQCNTTPGDDDIDDTLPDLSCWSQQDIANNAGVSLNNSNVLNTWHNIMSYHGAGDEDRFTEDQLDVITESIYNYTTRDVVVGGMPIYVDVNAFCFFCDGSPNQPRSSVSSAITEIENNFHNEGSNYVMILEGGQTEILSGTANSTISTPMRLTSKRNGTFTIR